MVEKSTLFKGKSKLRNQQRATHDILNLSVEKSLANDQTHYGMSTLSNNFNSRNP